MDHDDDSDCCNSHDSSPENENIGENEGDTFESEDQQENKRLISEDILYFEAKSIIDWDAKQDKGYLLSSVQFGS